MTLLMTSPTSDELLAMPGKLYRHIQAPVWNARARSDDLLSRDALRRNGARVRRARGIRQLFDVSPLPSCFLSSIPILESFHCPNCSIVDTGSESSIALLVRSP